MNNLKFIKGTLTVLKWLLLAGTLFAVIFIAFLQDEMVLLGSPSVEIKSETLRSSLNRQLEFKEDMQFTVKDLDASLAPSLPLKFAIIFSAILVCMYLVWILQIIIHIVKDIRNSEVFRIVNIQRLKRIAWLIVLAPFLESLLHFIFLIIINSRYQLPEELAFNWFADFDFNLLVIGLLLYAIAIAFGEGLKLKEEQELTI